MGAFYFSEKYGMEYTKATEKLGGEYEIKYWKYDKKKKEKRS